MPFFRIRSSCSNLHLWFRASEN